MGGEKEKEQKEKPHTRCHILINNRKKNGKLKVVSPFYNRSVMCEMVKCTHPTF